MTLSEAVAVSFLGGLIAGIVSAAVLAALDALTRERNLTE